jgi:hypothetical protein
LISAGEGSLDKISLKRRLCCISMQACQAKVQGYLGDFGLRSCRQKRGVGVGRLRRVRSVFFFCIAGVRVLTTDAVGEAVGAGVVVTDAVTVGVGVGNAAGVAAIMVGISVASEAAAGTCSGVGLFAIPNRIATIAERITTAERSPPRIAQRKRRWVCRCRASARLRSISPRSRISRSDAVTLSYAGGVESSVSKK